MKLQVQSLQGLVIHMDNERRKEVHVFDVLRELLPKHPNITDLKIELDKHYDEKKSLELFVMIVRTLTKLERLVVWNYSTMTANDIDQISPLKSLKCWQINKFKSKSFYKI